jgi:hypothetical protein
MMIADTDVLIDYLQGRGGAAERIALELERAQLYTTAVSRSPDWAHCGSRPRERL